MNILALGTAACKVAEKFKNHGHYEIFCMDDSEEEYDCHHRYHIKTQGQAEGYESAPLLKITSFLKPISNEVIFIVCGASTVSAASLAILEKIKKRTKITVLYIKPDKTFLGPPKAALERVVCSVLQEYSRSGLFERIYMVSNEQLLDILPETTISNMYETINVTLAYWFNLFFVFINNKPLVSNMPTQKKATRISSLGFFDFENFEKKMFFPLDNSGEMYYYCGVTEKMLENDLGLYDRIRSKILEDVAENQRVGFALYKVDFEEPVGLVCMNTSIIQQEKKI